MLRHFLVPLGVGALALAACQPVTTPPPPPQPVGQYCAPSIPSSPAQYQSAFDSLRRTYTEWASGDVSVPITLPDGRVLWLFGDTWIGKVLADGSITPTTQLEHNSFVVQTGACFAPQTGGAPLARTERIADPAPNQWYWPASGFVDGSTVRIFLWHLRAAPAPLHFTIIGMKVATLSLPSLAVASITALPFTALPGVFYGATATLEGSTVYAYGRHERDGYVARAPVAQFTTASAWEFWGNAGSGGPDAWVPDPSRAIPMTFSGMAPIDPAFGSGSGPGSPLAVVRDGTRYLASAMLLDAFADEVSVFSATTPAGPWTYHGSMHTTPSPGISSYGALIRFGLPGVAGPTVIYSTNDFLFDTFEAPPSIPLYGPRFTAPDPGSIPP